MFGACATQDSIFRSRKGEGVDLGDEKSIRDGIVNEKDLSKEP